MRSNQDIEALREFVHENTDLELLEDIVEQFNIFTSLDIVNQEIRHSNFLAWLMNPKETHGLGDYFLVSFLKKTCFKALSLEMEVPSIFDIESWNFDDAEILREWRNIDILIRSDDHKFVCVVENKIYSGEHGQQLQRYKSIIDREYARYKKLFVYLTVEGDIPSKAEYIPLTYTHIAELIEQVIESKKSKLATEILAFVSHYKEMLRRYVMQDSEIQEICRKIYKRHKKALDLIFENIPDALLQIHDSLVDLIKEDPDLILDESSKSYIRFIPRSLDLVPKEGEGWTKSKRILLFEFNNNPRGVILYLLIGPGTQEVRQRLYEIARGNLSLFNKSSRSLSKYWFSIYKKNLLSKKN